MVYGGLVLRLHLRRIMQGTVANPTPAAPSRVPWWAVWAMAYTVILAFIAAIFVFRDPDNSKTLLIALVTLTTGAAGFYWGSSKDTESNTAALATSTPAQPLTAHDEAEANAAADALKAKTATGAP